jgi:hypothetical protein
MMMEMEQGRDRKNRKGSNLGAAVCLAALIVTVFLALIVSVVQRLF